MPVMKVIDCVWDKAQQAPVFEMTAREADYTNGDFAVFARYDKSDVEWLVARVGSGVMRTVPLDKYEAIRIADEYKQAWGELDADAR